MEPEPTVLDSLRKAVEAMPDDVPLRLHLATMLLQSGQRDEAVRQLGAVLQRDPGNAEALRMLTSSPEGPGPPAPPPAGVEDSAERVRGFTSPAPAPTQDDVPVADIPEAGSAAGGDARPAPARPRAPPPGA